LAEELQVGGSHVKIRSPFGVFVLAIVTLGIYYLVWYFKVNREIRDATGIGWIRSSPCSRSRSAG
jgi:hypothetical protein